MHFRIMEHLNDWFWVAGFDFRKKDFRSRTRTATGTGTAFADAGPKQITLHQSIWKV